MVKVYFVPMDSKGTVSEKAAMLLDRVVKESKLKLDAKVPMKVHFGEEGNITYIKAENYDGLLDYLKKKKVKTAFMDTNVMYGGKRCNKSLHIETAKRHGFTRTDVIIADGDVGENYYEAPVKGKHFKSCKLGKEYARYKQFIIASHFKGHMLAGFGGAIKNLAMGFASRGGKLAMHMDTKPKIINFMCKKCHLCEKHCPSGAIHIEKRSYIDYAKCTGCAACTGICPHRAITVFSMKSVVRMLGFGNPFNEKMAEYALAASYGKKHIYINFLMDISPGCDCEGRKMKPMMADIGVLASTDPVAIDQACYDLVLKAGKKLRGAHTLEYAEEISVGSRKYELVRL